tara:strand:+ start:446 stop:1363 length:918 start_codon:yes stop_codon:yes gene_type:complete
MSQIHVDDIYDKTGSGRPEFPAGLTASGPVSIAGTLTYEDVTNIDSVGVITARTGVRITAGGIVVSAGFSTLSHVKAGSGATVLTSGNAEFVGIVTSNTCFKVGNGSFGPGIGVTITGDGNIVSTGVVTATTFNGAITAGTGATIFSPASNVITAGTASTEVVRINADAGVLLNNGILVERVKIDSDSINSDKFIRLQDGMVHYRSSAVGAASVKPDIVSNTGINTDLAIGDTIAVTLITVAGNTSHFVSSVAIDGKHTGITTHWVGGSTPAAGGGSGVDTYTFNILKTASETYTVIANQVLTSS